MFFQLVTEGIVKLVVEVVREFREHFLASLSRAAARELLREPYWALKAQQELGVEPLWPTPYGYAVKRRAK